MDVGKVALIFAFLLLVPLTSALTPHEQGEVLNLRVPFEVDGAAASPSATCNLTMQFPNSTDYVVDSSMTNQNNGYFNISLDQTETLGLYQWTAFCCDGASCAAGYGEVQVTPSGTIPTTAQGILYFVTLLVVFIVFGLTLYGAITIKWGNPTSAETGKVVSVSDLKYVKVGLWVVAYLFFVFIMAIMKGITGNFLVFNDAFKFFEIVLEVSLILIYPILIAGAWIVIFNVFADKKTYSFLERMNGGRR